MDCAYNNRRGEESSTIAYRRPEAHQRSKNQQAGCLGHREAVVEPETTRLLMVPAPTGNASVNIEGLTRPARVVSLANVESLTDSKKNQLLSSGSINEIDPGLGKLLSKLCNHTKAREENKTQIELLRTDIENLISLSMDHAGFDDVDTADFLHAALNTIKVGLRLIVDNLNNPDFPEKNIKYLYQLARLQLPFYFTDLPYWPLSLMVFTLKEGNQSCFGCNASEKTKMTIDKMLTESSSDEAMSDNRISQLIDELDGRVTSFKETFSAGDNSHLLRLGVWLKAYKTTQASVQPREPFTRYFNFSDEDVQESIFPQLNSLCALVLQPIRDFTSLLESLNKHGSHNSGNPNLYYLQAERWSVSVLESVLSNNHSTEEPAYVDDIISQLQALKQIVESQSDGFIADSSVFLHTLFAPKKPEGFITGVFSSELLTTPLSQSFENWLFDGLFHYFHEIFDEPDVDIEQIDQVKKIRVQVDSWLRQIRTQRGHENTLEEIIRATQSISLSMENIRSCTRDTREQTLLNEALRTSFKDSAREYFSGQQIDTPCTGSPEELMSMFAGFETILEVKRGTHLLDMRHLKSDFLKNSRADNRLPAKEWQLKFVEAHLSADQYFRSQKTQAKKNRSHPYFLERDPKNPSVLGTGMMKIDKGIGRMLGGKCYHKKHKVDESTRLGSTWPGSTGPEGTKPSCSVDLPDEDEDCSSDDGIDIDWTKGAGCTAHNFLHDNDANHAANGVLEENVGGLDYALPSPDVMKNWYVAFEKSTVQFFSKHSSEAKTEKLKVQQLQAINYLNSLANDKTSIHRDHNNFLLKILSLLRSENTPRSQTDQFETVAKQAIDQYGKDQFILIASGETVQREDDIEPLVLPTEFCERLSPFFKTIVLEIASTDFRHDLTADIYSVEILQQITGFLNMQVTAGSVTQETYKHLGLCDTTFRTLENYFRRLASEHVEHKKDLLAERFYDMFSGTSPLPVKHSSFLSALQNHHIHDFQAEVENRLKKSALSKEKPATEGITEVMDSIQQCYKDVIVELKKDLRKSQTERVIPCMIQGEDLIELSPAQHHQMLQNKIQAGEALLKNLEATIEAFKLGDENLTPTDRWNRFSEWVENHEAGIMAVYCMGMGVSIYYLIQGKTHTPHHYHSGGQLPFGSYDAGIVSIDAAQVVTTAGAVITQFGQATGWKNDVRRMLELLQNADAFSFITTEPPSTLQSDMVNLYLSKYKPGGEPTTFDTTCQNGSYCSGFNPADTRRDVAASALTRESPLQQSHPYTDRAIRVLGSTFTGALNGAAFSAISSVTSAACAPLCSWAPVIDQPFQTMVGTGAAAGCLGGFASGTKLDYLSRALNFSTRFFADDRTMGGMRTHVDQVIKCMMNRKNSTLVRLLIENPFKAALNICGFSLPESFVKGTLHLVDGWIAQTEISDFAQWRKAHQRLLSTAAAFNKVFDGKALTQYDRKVLIETLGEDNVRTLLNDQAGSKACRPDFQRFLSGVANLLAYYVMIADLHYFLYSAIFKASQPGEAAVSTDSGTTGQSNTSPASTRSERTSPAGTVASFNTGGECPANTVKLPSAGDGWLECPVALYEEFRKGAPVKRFFDVAVFKTLPNVANYFDVKAHNAALGKKSNDSAMVVTLKAGLAKNTALGPAERLLQMSDSILLKCVGDVINQMNTNIKEAMESVGQRERDKASEALKKAAKDIFWRLLIKADYNLPLAEGYLVDLISYWQENIGFKGLNDLAAMRQLIAQEALEGCDASQGAFSDYKRTAMDRLATVMPSVTDKSAVVPLDLREDVERLKARVNQFTFDVNAGKDMFRAVTPLFEELESVDPKVIDYYLESRLYKPFSKSCANSMKRADETPWMRVQHVYGQLTPAAGVMIGSDA